MTADEKGAEKQRKIIAFWACCCFWVTHKTVRRTSRKKEDYSNTHSFGSAEEQLKEKKKQQHTAEQSTVSPNTFRGGRVCACVTQLCGLCVYSYARPRSEK